MPRLLETHVETRRYILPGQSNSTGTAHGGDLLKWIEQTGAMSAMRFAGRDTVTVGVDDVRFHRPIPQGSIALLESYVVSAGESSVTAHVRVFEEDRHTAERELAVEGRVVSVALEEGDSALVPELTVETEKGGGLREAALDGE
jgi:acyl-CoA hydrolase